MRLLLPRYMRFLLLELFGGGTACFRATLAAPISTLLAQVGAGAIAAGILEE